jgi:hypothetical protein
MKKLLSLFFVGSFLFVACTGTNIANMSEKDRFINALTEATCAAFDIGFMDHEAVEAKTLEILEKYGFDGNDEAEMIELQERYEEDLEEAMMDALRECAPQEFLDMMESFETSSFEVSEEDMDFEVDEEMEEEEMDEEMAELEALDAELELSVE